MWLENPDTAAARGERGTGSGLTAIDGGRGS
jgi:hypothetical protein